MDLQAIKKRWDRNQVAYRGLSYEQAKADMDALMAEVERLQGAEDKATALSLELTNAKLLHRNMQQQMVDEVQAVVRKYDTF